MHRQILIRIPILAGILFFLLFFSCEKSENRSRPDPLFTKGRAAYLKRDFQEAESLFLASLRKQKNHVPTHVMLGKSRYYQGNQKAAAEAFRNLLKQDADNVTALTWLAKIEGIEQGNREKGIAYCDQALKSDVDNYLVHLYKGILLDESGATKEAILSYTSALELGNIIHLAHYKLARLYEEKGLKDKAIEEFKETLKYSPGKELEADIKTRLGKYGIKN